MRKLILFSLLLIASCKTLAPSASPAMQLQVQNLILNTSLLYNNIIQSSDKSYNSYSAAYQVIESEISSIIETDKSRANAANQVSIAINGQAAFLKFEGEHKSKITITNAAAQSYNDAMKAYWQPLLQSELYLK